MKFIDVKKCKFTVEPKYYFFGWTKSAKILGRESAVKALIKARKFLPKGYNFKIWDCKRPLKVQLAMLKSFKRRLSLLYPKLSQKDLKKIVLKFGAKPLRRVLRLDTHRLGGSFDLTIIDKNKNELYMGADFDDLTQKAKTDYFENRKQLTLLEREAKKNRRFLKRIMIKAGFKNYAAEWWHWSFDK